LSFSRYPKYKPSGVEWLGDVPEHWEIWKLAHAFSVIGSGTTPKTDNRVYYDDGEIPWINTGDLNDGELDSCEKRITQQAIAEHSSLKLYPIGSLLIAMYGATIGKLGMLRFPATVNQACCVFSGNSPILTRFMFYWFIGLRQQILSLATGGGQPNVSQDILRTLRVGCPDIDEQSAIAAFLDRETSKIDSLVGEQRRLIDLLKDKRQAVISHAVTKGLNPQAPLKPSGIHWLGDVPEHWSVKRLKRLVQHSRRITYGIVQPGEPDPTGRFMIRGKDYSEGWCSPDEIFRVSDGIEIPYTRSRMREHDLVMTIVGAGVGNVAMIPVWLDGSNITQTTARIAVDPQKAEPAYVCLALQGIVGQRNLERYVYGSAQPRLNIEHVDAYLMTVPPLSEQREIVASLNFKLEKLDALTAEAERAIELLQERRTALISAAVTGKIDVRNACALEIS
jgi:type I restriction enzyme S subunit